MNIKNLLREAYFHKKKFMKKGIDIGWLKIKITENEYLVIG